MIGEDDYFAETRFDSYECGLVLILMTTTSTSDDWYACHKRTTVERNNTSPELESEAEKYSINKASHAIRFKSVHGISIPHLISQYRSLRYCPIHLPRKEYTSTFLITINRTYSYLEDAQKYTHSPTYTNPFSTISIHFKSYNPNVRLKRTITKASSTKPSTTVRNTTNRRTK